MQVLQDHFFYHSYSRVRDDASLKKERQLLVEEQKLCKAQARKFSLETNRRRKALDERRKQWDVQEQRLRERILQQRRLQVQDATERFQRAHLPPSERRRQSFKRSDANIEDALHQIQGTFSSYTRQSSFLSSSINVNGCSPSPRPPTVSKSSHRQALSAVEAYTKLLLEQSRMEKEHDDSPQGSHLSDSCLSESLSSKDSLENEDFNYLTKTLQSSYSSLLLGTERTHQDLRKQNDLCHQTSDFSAMMLLGDKLVQANKRHEPNQKKLDESSWSNNKINVSKASWGFTSVEQRLKTEIHSALHSCNLSAHSENVGGDLEPQNSPSGNIIIANIAALGNGALDSSYPEQEDLLAPKQERIQHDRQLKYPTAEIPLLAKNSNGKDVLFGDPPKPNIFLNDSTSDNLSEEGSLQQTGRGNSALSSHKKCSASINNLNKITNSESNTMTPTNAKSMKHTCLSTIQSDTYKWLKCPEKEVEKIPFSVETSDSVCEVRYSKGILKKQSKYMDSTCVHGSGNLIFAKQVALAIRDSVELARRKSRDLEGNNAVKKKLRWFDEVHVEKEKDKQTKGKSPNLCQPKTNSDDHQLSLSAFSGTPKTGPDMTPAASTGYQFTKEAWADVQVNLPKQQTDEVKAHRISIRASAPKVPRKEHFGRAGPVSSRTRKGTVIRPQSATEVSQIAKTQGKIMVPRPPPRMESVEEKTPCIIRIPYGRDRVSAVNKQAMSVEQVLSKNNSEGHCSAKTHAEITTESTVLDTPRPPSFASPLSEGIVTSSSHQETHHYRRRGGNACNEKGLCLDCTPTDEEISQLWHGVRSALTAKDAKLILKAPALESGRVLRKPCTDKSRQAPGSENRRLHQTSQQTKQTAKLLRPFSSTYNSAFLNEDFESAAQLHLAEVHAKGHLKEKDLVAAMETVQTQRSGTVELYSQQQELTTISLEEKKILLCLDQLNHQLQYVQERVGGNTSMHGLVLSDAPYTREASNHNKHCGSSANSHSRYHKKS